MPEAIGQSTDGSSRVATGPSARQVCLNNIAPESTGDDALISLMNSQSIFRFPARNRGAPTANLQG